jgi:stalled ribosome alternative rescue factor ArfA
MSDIGNSLDNGSIDIPQARELVKQRLLQTREDAYKKGKKQYDKKKEELGSEGFNLSGRQIASNNENTKILNAWANDTTITGPKKFNYIVRSPESRATTTQQAYEISKTADGRYFLISNGRPEALSPKLAKEMFNIDLK